MHVHASLKMVLPFLTPPPTHAPSCNYLLCCRSAEVPRPEEGKEVLGVGEIFVEFEDIEAATKGRKALGGRKFGGKAVKAVFYPLDLFQVRPSVPRPSDSFLFL